MGPMFADGQKSGSCPRHLSWNGCAVMGVLQGCLIQGIKGAKAGGVLFQGRKGAKAELKRLQK